MDENSDWLEENAAALKTDHLEFLMFYGFNATAQHGWAWSLFTGYEMPKWQSAWQQWKIPGVWDLDDTLAGPHYPRLTALLKLMGEAIVAGGTTRLKSDDTVPPIWPTNSWATSTQPEQEGMDSGSLAKAVEFVRDFNEGGTTADSSGYYHPPKRSDAFVVARHGRIVTENYWGSTNSTSMHTVESGTKSIGAMLIMHAALKGQFTFETNVSDYFPALKPLSKTAATPPLQVKHLISMAGGLNVTYYKNWTDKHSSELQDLYPGMLQGPPGAIQSVVRPGILLPPGSDFHYSMPNPILAEGILAHTSQTASFADYGAKYLFPILGIISDDSRRLKSDDGDDRGGWSGPELRQVSNAEGFPALSLDGGDPFPPFWLVTQRVVEMAAAERNLNQTGGPPNCSPGAAPDRKCCSGPHWCLGPVYCQTPAYGCSEPHNILVQQLVRAREAGIQLVVVGNPDTNIGHASVCSRS